MKREYPIRRNYVIRSPKDYIQVIRKKWQQRNWP